MYHALEAIRLQAKRAERQSEAQLVVPALESHQVWPHLLIKDVL